MHESDRRQFLRGFWATSLGTLVSRVLGMLRDVATAALLGLGNGGVLDALVLAFRIPNLMRRLLGEGALATSYLPVLTAELERDRAAGMQLAAAFVASLAGVLAIVVLVGESLCAIVWLYCVDPSTQLLVGLTAALLPYLWFICLAAQLSTTLHALSRFSLPAVAAGFLNICWLAGAWWIAPVLSTDKVVQSYVLAGCILVAGLLQVVIQLPLLWKFGFRLRCDWNSSRTALQKIMRNMAPIAIALSVTQLNTFIDSLIAWLLTAPAEVKTISWLPGSIAYPLTTGATAALYYAERFYQLPVGLLGVALATVIYPLLSRHAAHGRRQQLGADLTFGLQLVWFLALPACMGLVLLAEPMVRVLFERGAFSAEDVGRTAHTIVAYSAGVWAYCAIPVIMRGFYALGDARTPLWTSVAAMAVNVGLDLILVWTLGEAGLALATALSSMIQAVLLIFLFSRFHCALDWRRLAACGIKTVAATSTMGITIWGTWQIIPLAQSRGETALAIAISIVAGGVVFAVVALTLQSPEFLALAPWAKRHVKSLAP